jgi:hypothetical protein
VRIVLKRTLSADDLGEGPCSICKRKFCLGPVTAWAISDSEILLGEICPACLEGGTERMERELRWRAYWSRQTADQDERLAAEGFAMSCPRLRSTGCLSGSMARRSTVTERRRRPP